MLEDSRGTRLRLAVLASGRGSNLQALLDAAREEGYPAEVILVLSDNREALALERARRVGVPAVWVDPRLPDPDVRMADEIERAGADLICLAGYMRVLPQRFVKRFEWRILNIHPSLLPSFPGLRAQRKALRAGVRVSGCTVHFVDEGVDTGPILLQAAVPVLPDDDEELLSSRILEYEHKIFPLAVCLVAGGKIRVEGQRVEIEGVAPERASAFISPPL